MQYLNGHESDSESNTDGFESRIGPLPVTPDIAFRSVISLVILSCLMVDLAKNLGSKLIVAGGTCLSKANRNPRSTRDNSNLVSHRHHPGSDDQFEHGSESTETRTRAFHYLLCLVAMCRRPSSARVLLPCALSNSRDNCVQDFDFCRVRIVVCDWCIFGECVGASLRTYC